VRVLELTDPPVKTVAVNDRSTVFTIGGNFREISVQVVSDLVLKHLGGSPYCMSVAIKIRRFYRLIVVIKFILADCKA
jgi:hypothetical protein